MRISLLLFTLFFFGNLNAQERIVLKDSKPINHTRDLKPRKQSTQIIINRSGGETCASAVSITIPVPGDCSTLGTAAFAQTSDTTGDLDGNTADGITPSPSCPWYAATDEDQWYTATIPAGCGGFIIGGGVNSLAGADSNYSATVYSGSCGSATELACNDLLFDGGLYSFRVDALPGTTIFIQIWDANNVYTGDDCEFVITPLPESGLDNEDCADAETDLTAGGCNYGAPPETSWSSPTVPRADGGAGLACNGNNWYSNDNPVYFCLTATSTNPVVEVNNIVCNESADGGIAQFAAFTSCANVGNYAITSGGAPANRNFINFLGCTAGVGDVSLQVGGAPGTAGSENFPDLSIGDKFILVVDGNAGDNCQWDFVIDGVAQPVDLMAFNAYAKERINILNWSTASEQNNAHFEIEKSYNGTRFELIGKVAGNGNSSENINYSFEDLNPTILSYYRLKQVDFDGTFEYSQVITVRRSKSWKEFNISPNPVKENLNISFFSASNRSLELKVSDIIGRALYTESVAAQKGLNNIEINTNDYLNGIYLVTISDGINQISQKLVKH